MRIQELREWVKIEQPALVFWRCKHYSSAISNAFKHELCEHGCHKFEPTWYSNGMSEVKT